MSRGVVTPLRYPGGKTQLYEYVKSLIEENDIESYIEPFMGGSGISFKLLLNKDIKKVFLNDYDRSIYAFWYSTLYHTNELVDLIRNTDITVEEWKKQKKVQENKQEEDLLILGFSTFFLNRTNRSGILKAGVIGGLDQSGNYKIDCRFNKENLIERIEEIAKHKNKIRLYNMDAVDFIRKIITRTKNSLTFFDPPYYLKGPDLYTNFYNHNDHVELSKTIIKHMYKRYWILTYDVVDEIKHLYKDSPYLKYYLRYTISSPNKGIEYMFFSDNINYKISLKYLRINDS